MVVNDRTELEDQRGLAIGDTALAAVFPVSGLRICFLKLVITSALRHSKFSISMNIV